MMESHFLIVPSRAECFGVVFAEASSFGLPSLATNVGGIPSAIRDGKNGQTFPLAANPDEYSDYIERFMSSKEEYKKLALSSFTEYSERLNWFSAGRRVTDLIREYSG
jgi:glycosyltransferase involved in cell wall biosynthesis